MKKLSLSFYYMPEANLTIETEPVDPRHAPELEHHYWQSHPRINFLVRTPPDGTLLDMGCAAGKLAFARDLYEPKRPDIKMLGCELEPGAHHDQYDKVVLGDYNTTPLGLDPNSVDAIVASHFFEHIENTEKFFRECGEVLKPGGEIYIEIPAEHTASLPHVDVLRAQGLPAELSNFFEDTTHNKTYTLDEITALAQPFGFYIVAEGYVTAPHVENELLYLGYVMQNASYATYGLLSKLNWSRYFIFKKQGVLDKAFRERPRGLSRSEATAQWPQQQNIPKIGKEKLKQVRQQYRAIASLMKAADETIPLKPFLKRMLGGK